MPWQKVDDGSKTGNGLTLIELILVSTTISGLLHRMLLEEFPH